MAWKAVGGEQAAGGQGGRAALGQGVAEGGAFRSLGRAIRVEEAGVTWFSTQTLDSPGCPCWGRVAVRE